MKSGKGKHRKGNLNDREWERKKKGSVIFILKYWVLCKQKYDSKYAELEIE